MSKSKDPYAKGEIWQAPLCQHFEINTYVKIGHRRGKVINNGTRWLGILFDDGAIETVYPFALSDRRRK